MRHAQNLKPPRAKTALFVMRASSTTLMSPKDLLPQHTTDDSDSSWKAVYSVRVVRLEEGARYVVHVGVFLAVHW